MSQLRRIAAAAALVCAMPLASATVLNFDDLGGLGFFTANYQGFMFGDNSAATNPWFHTTQVSPFYKPSSGAGYVSTDFSLYDNTNASQATQPISNTTAFKFDGAFFSGNLGDTITYRLFNGLTLVSTSAPSAALTYTPQFFSSGYTGLVTSVVIVGRQGFYAMDDFTFNTPVPEPESYALMLAGLLAVTTVVRRRSNPR